MSQPNNVQKIALAVTRSIGSPASIAIHSILFLISFVLAFTGWISFDRMFLILTTIVSLEAIYLAIFIQMTLNYTTESIEEVAEDIEEIQEDVGEIQENVDELQEDVEEMSEDEVAEESRKTEQKHTLVTIQNDLRKLMQDIEKLQKP
ncbi:DUF1003 domain-containing protein [Candidatus Kaiserbacteria bacterium]|nr:DUF1003 domain-containing protein [Candidatus Kaiserbacteria bacterium]